MASPGIDNPYEKYALCHSVTADSFSMSVDGKVVGPGPAHFGELKTATVAAADWLWITAEASHRRGGKGHHHEWSTVVFSCSRVLRVLRVPVRPSIWLSHSESIWRTGRRGSQRLEVTRTFHADDARIEQISAPVPDAGLRRATPRPGEAGE